jgi:hypothetical protein
VVSTVACDIIGNRADTLFSKVMGRTAAHFVKANRRLANHDILKSVIAAHLDLRSYDEPKLVVKLQFCELDQFAHQLTEPSDG